MLLNDERENEQGISLEQRLLLAWGLVCELAEERIVVESSAATEFGSETTQTTARILLFGSSGRAQCPQGRVGDVAGHSNAGAWRCRPVGECASIGKCHLLRICWYHGRGQSSRLIGEYVGFSVRIYELSLSFLRQDCAWQSS